MFESCIGDACSAGSVCELEFRAGVCFCQVFCMSLLVCCVELSETTGRHWDEPCCCVDSIVMNRAA